MQHNVWSLLSSDNSLWLIDDTAHARSELFIVPTSEGVLKNFSFFYVFLGHFVPLLIGERQWIGL